MSDRDFGGTIRRRRERLGLSVSRVAELVGRAPGTVRAWERGTAVPEEPSVVSTLAAVLGLDESATFQLAGLAPPVTDGQVTVEQALRSLTDVDRPVSRYAAADPGRAPRAAARGVDLADSEATVDPPGEGAPARSATGPPIPEQPPAAPRPTPVQGTGTHAVPVPDGPGIMERLRTATTRKPQTAPPLTTLPTPAAEPSYMEDPMERWSYRMRSIFTAAGIALLLLVFGWAAANFLDAIGETWDILTQNL